jgi:hypothetical protein
VATLISWPCRLQREKLTTHQQAVLIQVLLAFPGQRVGIQTSPSAVDAAAYAQNFLAIFKACGWNVDQRVRREQFPGWMTPGLTIVVLEDHHLRRQRGGAARRLADLSGGRSETVCEPASTD